MLLQHIRFVVSCPEEVNAPVLLRWLTEVFEVSPAECPDPQDEPARLLANASLLMARYLLQASQIPVWAPGRLLALSPQIDTPEKFNVLAVMPLVDHMPLDGYRLAVSTAATWLPNFVRHAPQSARIAQLHQAIQEQVAKPLSGRVPAGKSTMHVLRAAHRMGIPFLHLGAGVYQLGWGARAHQLDRSAVAHDGAIGMRISNDKAATARMLRAAGLPAATHQVATNEAQAQQAARALGWPVVVKPADADRGEGVSVDVRTLIALSEAFGRAQAASRSGRVLIERQVPGVCHRLFIAFGRLLYAVKRWPRSVLGDGQHDVKQLIDLANRAESQRPLWLREGEYPADALAQEVLQQQGLTLNAVAAAGQRVALRPLESTPWGGFDEDVSHVIHPENLDAALRAVSLLGLTVAGVDLISPDIGTPWHANGAIINELNFAPLLGGGDISRAHIPEFLALLMQGHRGRIEIEAFVGGEQAWQQAVLRQSELLGMGQQAFTSSHAQTLMPGPEAGAPPVNMHLPFSSLIERTRALLMDRRVEHLLLVVQTDEILRRGLPLDALQAIHRAGDALLSPEAASPPMAAQRLQEVFELLHPLLLSDSVAMDVVASPLQ